MAERLFVRFAKLTVGRRRPKISGTTASGISRPSVSIEVLMKYTGWPDFRILYVISPI